MKGLSLKEVALITGQSENTVAVQVHRGLRKLKIMYDEGEEHTVNTLLDKQSHHG